MQQKGSQRLDTAMRIEGSGPGDGAAALSAAALAAQAAREVARRDIDPTHRAESGWALAEKPEPGGFQAALHPSADAGANARTAMARQDLPTPLREQVRHVVEHLGHALLDGRIDPHVNDAFRDHLHSLATEPADSPAFRGALAQMNRAAEVLARVELAQGTRLAYDANAHQPEVTRSGLPILDVDNIDADLYFKTRDGTLHIESVKASPLTFENAIDTSLQRLAQEPPTQLDRQAQWQAESTLQQPRRLGLYLLDPGPGFYHLLKTERLDSMASLVGGDTGSRRFVVGQQAYSLDELREVARGATAAAPEHVAAQLRDHIQAGKPEKSFSVATAYRTAYSELAGDAQTAFRRFGAGLGEAQAPLKPMPTLAPPSASQGALWGGLAAGAMTLVHLGREGELTTSELGQAGLAGAEGAGIGALAAVGERFVTPWVDQVVGRGVQQWATTAAPQIARTAQTALPTVPTVARQTAGLATAEGAALFGAGTRTLVARVGGASVVGAAIATGLSAYENRAGLARGDAQAIGNVAADTAVAAGSIGAATLSGAAIGSLVPVPVVGTVVGAAVGLAVGVGVAYGAQISGARDWLAGQAAGAVNGLKSLF